MPSSTCIICLHGGHSRKRCTSKGSCYFCSSKNHNSAFCPKKFGLFKRPENNTNTISNDTANQGKTITAENAPKNTPNTSRKVALLRTQRSTHITARANITNPITNKTLAVRILFDCGSPDSYILKSIAEQLDLISDDQTKLQILVFASEDFCELTSDTV